MAASEIPEIPVDTRRESYAAWIVATGAAVVAILLIVVLVVQLARPAKYRISSSDQQAMDVASQAMLNLTTYKQKSFESDFTRALSELSGQALSGAQAQHDTLVQVMTAAKLDLKGEVTATALESSSNEGVTVLLYLNSYKVLSDGSSQKKDSQALELTMKHTTGKWLLDDIAILGITQ